MIVELCDDVEDSDFDLEFGRFPLEGPKASDHYDL